MATEKTVALDSADLDMVRLALRGDVDMRRYVPEVPLALSTTTPWTVGRLTSYAPSLVKPCATRSTALTPAWREIAA